MENKKNEHNGNRRTKWYVPAIVARGDEFTVVMGYSAVSYSNTRLITFGLSTCVGLAVTSNNFAFLAHLDMSGMIGFSFDRESPKCIATEQLMDEIRERKEQITQPLNIQLIFGHHKSLTVSMNQEQMNLLYSGLDDVCRLCQKLGITVNRIPDGISSKVTVDSEDGIILFDRDNEYIDIPKEAMKLNENRLIGKKR